MDDEFQPKWHGRWRHIFLAFLVCLLMFNFTVLLLERNFALDRYGNLVVSAILLLNHIAFHYTKTGQLSMIMKTLAMMWAICGLVYIFWVVAT
ncbi:MAG: hypothetical protein M3R24_18095 [Chloroflexota bacterium]|nr:hypothetical protein [Chloroflexota bacterium]